MDYETIEELAARLKVPKSWIYERTRKSEIPCYRLGRHIRFIPFEIDKWLRNKTSISGQEDQ